MKKGFTLIELLVVVLIIGILAAIALPQYTTAVEKSRSAEAVTLMGTLRYAGERFRLQNSAWPNDDMASLDIEVPAATKNFNIATANDGSNWKITATRNGTGDLTYVLTTVVTPDGTATRTCTGGDSDGRICAAITSGHPTDGSW